MRFGAFFLKSGAIFGELRAFWRFWAVKNARKTTGKRRRFCVVRAFEKKVFLSGRLVPQPSNRKLGLVVPLGPGADEAGPSRSKVSPRLTLAVNRYRRGRRYAAGRAACATVSFCAVSLIAASRRVVATVPFCAASSLSAKRRAFANRPNVDRRDGSARQGKRKRQGFFLALVSSVGGQAASTWPRFVVGRFAATPFPEAR